MLAPLINRDFLRIVDGDAEVGKYLTNHPTVSAVHFTGSADTYDAIVWQGKPKKGSPPFSKPVTGELGGVTPVIMAPGSWSEADLK